MNEYDQIVAACTRPNVVAQVRLIKQAAPRIADTLAGWTFTRNVVEDVITDAIDEVSAHQLEVSHTPSRREIDIVVDAIMAVDLGGAE